MHNIVRLFAIGVVFVSATIAWMVLGQVVVHRTDNQTGRLGEEVNSLWGKSQTQNAPSLQHSWETTRIAERSETIDGKRRTIREPVTQVHTLDVSTASSTLRVDLKLDQRLRGLLWYSLYDVTFDGAWTYEHREATSGVLRVGFRFPDPAAVYDTSAQRWPGQVAAGQILGRWVKRGFG